MLRQDTFAERDFRGPTTADAFHEANPLEAQGDSPVLRSSIEAHMAYLQGCADELQRQIDDHIDWRPNLKRDTDLLHRIPGIRQVTAPKALPPCCWRMCAAPVAPRRCRRSSA